MSLKSARAWWDRFWDVHWFEIGIGSFGAVITAIIVGVVPGVPDPRLQAFFETAAQVNAALLLSVFVLASFFLPRMEDPDRLHYSMFFLAATAVFFVGLVDSGVGILLPQSGLNAQIAVGGILVSWWLGLAMLTDALRNAELVRR